ncbi:MAG: undecaprenyl-diphosphate phosphatase [Opitutus sp.]
MRKLRLTILWVAGVVTCCGQSTKTAARDVSPNMAAAELSLSDAAILGAVEGLTEFLPVSSTGHLIIAAHALHLDSNVPLRSPSGDPLWYKTPSTTRAIGEPLTLKLAADTYTVVIQFGAIAAIAFLYWRQLLSLIKGLFGKDPIGLRLLRNLLLAFFPAAVIGLALHNWIDRHLFSVGAVVAAQVVGAGIIFWAEAYRKRRSTKKSESDPTAELSAQQALNIGVLQCAALWPGMSRSMMTIVGGYIAGLEPRRAAEFSFLLGLVTLSAATAFKGYNSGHAMIAVFGWPHVIAGCVVAALTACLAVKFLVGWLSRHGMIAFAYYRLAFAAVLAGLTWM